MKFDFEYQCDKEWDDMKGGDRRRFCDSCEKHVHHISGMTEKQARKFLEEHDYEVCVDFYRDGHGHTKFRDAAKKLRLQNDGLKQLLASAAAVIPLALAAAFVDFDDEPTPPVAHAAFNAPTPVPPVTPRETPSPLDDPIPAPIDIDGDEPVFVDSEPRQPTESPSAAVRPIPVEPFTAEPEPEEPAVDDNPEPVVKPIRHVRGRIRRPVNWGPEGSARNDKPLPVDPFEF